MMGYYGNYMFGFGGLGALLAMLWWVVVITGLIMLIRWMVGGTHPHYHGHVHGSGREAIDILKERYAKGEITKAQFEQMRKDIES